MKKLLLNIFTTALVLSAVLLSPISGFVHADETPTAEPATEVPVLQSETVAEPVIETPAAELQQNVAALATPAHVIDIIRQNTSNTTTSVGINQTYPVAWVEFSVAFEGNVNTPGVNGFALVNLNGGNVTGTIQSVTQTIAGQRFIVRVNNLAGEGRFTIAPVPANITSTTGVPLETTTGFPGSPLTESESEYYNVQYGDHVIDIIRQNTSNTTTSVGINQTYPVSWVDFSVAFEGNVQTPPQNGFEIVNLNGGNVAGNIESVTQTIAGQRFIVRVSGLTGNGRFTIRPVLTNIKNTANANIHSTTGFPGSPYTESESEYYQLAGYIAPVVVTPPSGGSGGSSGGFLLPTTFTTTKTVTTPANTNGTTTIFATKANENIASIGGTYATGGSDNTNTNGNGSDKSNNTSMCAPFTEYMRIGQNNDPRQVQMLQNFLNVYYNAGLTVNGNYDTKTFNAVKSFQHKYADVVLQSWGQKTATGYFYKTTRATINAMLGCPENIIQVNDKYGTLQHIKISAPIITEFEQQNLVLKFIYPPHKNVTVATKLAERSRNPLPALSLNLTDGNTPKKTTPYPEDVYAAQQSKIAVQKKAKQNITATIRTSTIAAMNEPPVILSFNLTDAEKQNFGNKVENLQKLNIDTCPAFNEYSNMNTVNTKSEVIKIQNFLNTFYGEKLTTDGNYNAETADAVGRFQNQYARIILKPWGYIKPTQRVYKTTRATMNALVSCPEGVLKLEDTNTFVSIQ